MLLFRLETEAPIRVMKIFVRSNFWIVAAAAALWLATGCSQSPQALSAEEQQELERLRGENQEVQKLRTANRELDRLRKDNAELALLRNSAGEIARFRAENDDLRKQIGALPAPIQQPADIPAATAAAAVEPPRSIVNFVQEFEEAALLVASQGDPRPEDIPQEGDQILIDQTVIGILIPEFGTRTNSQQYEISGWLKSKGVLLKNYQQFNSLGITNFQIRRTPPEAK